VLQLRRFRHIFTSTEDRQYRQAYNISGLSLSVQTKLDVSQLVFGGVDGGAFSPFPEWKLGAYISVAEGSLFIMCSTSAVLREIHNYPIHPYSHVIYLH